MDEELATGAGELGKVSGTEVQFSKSLPAVGDDEILSVPPTATQIEHQPFFANRASELSQAVPIHTAFTKNPRSNDDMRCADAQPSRGVVQVDASADLQAARKGS